MKVYTLLKGSILKLKYLFEIPLSIRGGSSLYNNLCRIRRGYVAGNNFITRVLDSDILGKYNTALTNTRKLFTILYR